jgi:hypothetical protein
MTLSKKVNYVQSIKNVGTMLHNQFTIGALKKKKFFSFFFYFNYRAEH